MTDIFLILKEDNVIFADFLSDYNTYYDLIDEVYYG